MNVKDGFFLQKLPLPPICYINFKSEAVNTFLKFKKFVICDILSMYYSF